MINATIGANEIFLLDRVLTMITQMLSNNPMLEARIPPDKFTGINIAVTHHKAKLSYLLHNKEPPDKFMVLNNTDYGSHPQQKTYGSHKINTEADSYVPLSMIYENHLSVSTTDKYSSLVEKLPPEKKFLFSSELHYLRRRIPPDKIFGMKINVSFFMLSTISVLGEKYSFYDLPITFITSKGHHTPGSIIPPHDTYHGKLLRLQGCDSDISSIDDKNLGHYRCIKDTI